MIMIMMIILIMIIIMIIIVMIQIIMMIIMIVPGSPALLRERGAGEPRRQRRLGSIRVN